MGKARKRRKAKGKQPAGLGPRFVLFSDGPVPQEGFCDIDPHQGAFEGPLISEESFQTDSPPHFVASIQKKQAVPKKKNHEPPELKKTVRPQKAKVQPPEFGSEPGLHPLHDEAHHLGHPDFENKPPGLPRPEFECGPGPVPLFRPPFDDGPIPGFHPQLANGRGRGFHPPPFGKGPDPDFRPQFDVPRPGFRPPFDDRPARGFHPPPLDDGPRFHPPPLDDGPRFHHPPLDDGPRFHPPPFDDGPRFHPPHFDDRPGFHPPPFDDGLGFHPAPFHDGAGPGPGRGFHPGPFDVRPGPRPGFHPGEFDDGRPGFVPTKFQGGPCYPGMEPGRDPMEGYGAQEIKLKSLLDIRVDPVFGARKALHAAPQDLMPPGPRPLMGLEVPPVAPSAPSRRGGQQGPKQAMNESGTTAAPKASTSSISSASDFKPPPGRSIGVISFVGNNYGFIDREDLKKFSFSFDAFLGNVANLIIGVKVHFTAVKEQGNEIATDVKVAPRGTEKIGDTVYEGVVIKVIPETYVMEPYPGCIRTILSTETVKLSFGKADARATLLMFDRVKFQLLTDIITKRDRATNITPQMPETFQLTKEIREKGLLMNVKDNTFFIMSKQHENLTASFSENLSDTDLNIMDEVEFTVLKVKDTTKAIRLKKLPEGSLVPNEQNTVLLGSKLESLTSEVAAKEEVEDVSSEKYEGTVFEIISKTPSKDEKQREELNTAQGLVDCVVEGTKKRLPFRSGDVVTQATMMVGDKVQFNIATKQRTKEERAVGIEIHPDTFHTETTEQRKIGVVMKLDDNSGFIRTPQYPQLFFYVKEVMEDTRLTLSEKVEFTLAVNKEVEEGKCAVRIRRLKESIFTSVPKLERLGEKEKKKMTIKLLMDPKEKIKYERNTEGQKGDLKEDSKQPPKSPNEEMKAKILKIKVEREESSSRDSSRRRSRSRDRDGSRYRRHRSSSRERSRYRRSRSRDRSHRSKHTCSRSRSRSPSRSGDRSSRSNRRRSHSPDERHGRREHSSKSDRRSDGSKSTTTKSGSTEADAVLYEIEKKKRELLELNELIARKRAIIAMEQGAGSLKGSLEMEGQQGIATFDYQHKPCLESAWMGDVKPVKSILKKPSESPVNPQFQPKVCSQGMVRYPNPVSHTSDWNQQSSSPQTEDQELARKKKQLDELNESIARKRAIMAMKQKAKGDLGGPPSKKEYDLADDVDTTEPNEDEWQLSIKPDLQPKKSILKKRSEGLSDQLKLDMAAHQYGYDHPSFSITNDPEDLSLPFLEKSGNSPSVPLPSQRSSSTSKFYARESKSDYPYEGVPHAQGGEFTSSTQERASASKETSKPPSQQQQELTTQMQRFLSALNKADSKLLSTMLREAKTDSESRKTEEKLPAQADEKASHKDELYDPFEGTDDHGDDSPYRDRIPGLGRSEDRLDDDLLPHERAVEDGSGFSRIVGLNYSSDAKAESRFAYRETGAPSSQSRFTEQCDRYKMSQDSFSEGSYFERPSQSVDGYQNPYSRVQDSHAEDSERYERQKDAEQYSVQASFSQGNEKAGEREASDASKKAENFEKLQNLLQTIGLNLDSAEFTKLADRTRERLYGKKAKSPSRSTKSDERLVSPYDRRGSSGRADSSESEGVRSVSPARSSNREVYMSYSDSLRHRGRRDERSASAEQENPVNLKRTISNSPEGSQAIPKQYKSKQPLATADGDLYPQSAPAQFISSLYAQESTQASLGAPYFPTTPDSLGPGLSKGLTGSSQISVSPYAAVSPGPLFFAAGHQAPAGFGTFAPTVGPSSVLSLALNMPRPPLPFSTQIPFHSPHLPFPTPVPAAQLSMSGEPGASTSETTWGMKKQIPQTRCLKEILPASKKIAVKKGRRSRGKNKPGKNPKQQVGAGVVPKQVTVITEEDIKAKQKKRLEKFNQRMKLKKEQQMEAQRNQQSQNSKPGKAIQNQVKNVWVCGHSLVFWAEKRATSPEIGMQLGMDPQSVKIWWKGVQGLTWEQFLPLLLQLKDNWPKPDVILMHLGGNDLGKTTAEAFLAAVKNDLISMKNIFPQCLLVWSDILPRRWWRHSEDCEEVDRVCKIINQGVHHILAELGGSSLTHENIMAGLDSGLYRPDGVHLSGRGIDTFNLNMQDFLEKWESEFEAPELSGV